MTNIMYEGDIRIRLQETRIIKQAHGGYLKTDEQSGTSNRTALLAVVVLTSRTFFWLLRFLVGAK